MRIDFRKIKWFFQKCKRGYSDKDLWNLDNWILDMLEKVINDFKIQNNHSYPSNFDSMDDWTAELEYAHSLLKHLNEEYYEDLNHTKDKLFDWLKKYLFDLWD